MLNTILIHSGTGQTAATAALALLIIAAALSLLLLHQPAQAQTDTKATSNLAVSSPNPGEIVITWDAPSDAPGDYWVAWKKSSVNWPPYQDDNTAQGGNAFPAETSYTVSDLEEGTAYSVRVRARYYDANDSLTESGPWSAPPVEVTVSSQLPSAENRSGKEQVPPRKSKKNPTPPR